jgi:hypothetical protein
MDDIHEGDAKGNRIIVPGEYSISIAGAQPEDSALAQNANFRVAGTKQLDK